MPKVNLVCVPNDSPESVNLPTVRPSADKSKIYILYIVYVLVVFRDLCKPLLLLDSYSVYMLIIFSQYYTHVLSNGGSTTKT